MSTEVKLKGKIALVTGASRKIGIGAAMARAFAAAGADVFVTYYRPYDAEMPWGSQDDEAEALIAELRSYEVRADGLELDLTAAGAPKRLFKQANEKLGTVDILVNNATYSVDLTLEQLTDELIDKHCAVNVRAMMMTCQAFAAQWHKQGEDAGGRIINLTSGQGLGAMPDNLAYAATKGSVDAFTVSLAPALAARGITVNAIDPGVTDTGWMPPAFKAELAARSPLGRVGQPQDAARLACLLASDSAKWVTGQIIRSRGGM